MKPADTRYGGKTIFRIHLQNLSSPPLHRRDLAMLFRQLSVMLSAGLTLTRSLRVLTAQVSRPALQTILVDIGEKLEEGLSFEEAVASSSGRFPPLVIHLIRAGETAGILADVLVKLSGYLENDDQIAAKIATTLIYPIIVLIFALVAILFIAGYIMPIFAELYATAGVPLPLLTRGMMGFGMILQHYPVGIAALITTLIIAAKSAAGTTVGRLWLDRHLLQVPLVGRVCTDMDIMRFTQLMAALLEAGVQVSDALEIAAGVLGNMYLTGIITETRQAMQYGEAMSDILLRYSVFPPLVVQMMAAGEESGSLACMFGELSRYTYGNLLIRVDRIMAILEPVLVLLVALVVGGIVLATLVPMYSIVSLTTGI